jgi:hypothetical protein
MLDLNTYLSRCQVKFMRSLRDATSCLVSILHLYSSCSLESWHDDATTISYHIKKTT